MKTMPVIRTAMPMDAGPLYAMQAQSMRALAAKVYSPAEVESSLAHIGTMDHYLIDDGTLFIAESGDQVVGCGGWTQRSPGGARAAANDAVNDGAKAPVVRSLFVHPQFARQGIARRIMTLIERTLVFGGHREATLTATLSGLPFYLSLGYQMGKTLHLRLPDDETFTVIAMRKQLVESGTKQAA
ncbi:MAG TPA: GNAT family N-acetyltransferase [Alphaproteobacteria bacterium]|nr:GNAT family N-acetyltransferase [Alphaproteobacteria bacterium]